MPTSVSNAPVPECTHCTTRGSTRAPTARTSGSPCGSYTTGPGDSPAASRARPPLRANSPSRPSQTATVSRVLSSAPVELAAEPVYADVTWVSSYDVDPFGVDEADRVGRLAELSERLLASDGVDHVDAQRADGAGEQVLRRPARHDHHPAARADRSRSSPSSTSTAAAATSSRCAPSHPPPDVVGSTSPEPAGTSTPSSSGCPNCCASTSRRRASTPGTYDVVDRSVQPVAHDPRVDRARDRARPRTRLRGGLRRHELRDARQARAGWPTAARS